MVRAGSQTDRRRCTSPATTFSLRRSEATNLRKMRRDALLRSTAANCYFRWSSRTAVAALALLSVQSRVDIAEAASCTILAAPLRSAPALAQSPSTRRSMDLPRSMRPRTPKSPQTMSRSILSTAEAPVPWLRPAARSSSVPDRASMVTGALPLRPKLAAKSSSSPDRS
jgi:hypothetical protein